MRFVRLISAVPFANGWQRLRLHFTATPAPTALRLPFPSICRVARPLFPNSLPVRPHNCECMPPFPSCVPCRNILLPYSLCSLLFRSHSFDTIRDRCHQNLQREDSRNSSYCIRRRVAFPLEEVLSFQPTSLLAPYRGHRAQPCGWQQSRVPSV